MKILPGVSWKHGHHCNFLPSWCDICDEAHILRISPAVLWQQFFIAPTSVTMLCTEEREEGNAAFRVKLMGDTSHLLEGNEPASDSGFFQEIYR